MILSVFASPERVAGHYGRFLNVDLAALPGASYAIALLIILIDVAFAWLVVLFIWRLFGHYLRGEIFSHQTVQEMRRGGWAGIAAVVADIIARPLLASALTMHLSEAQSPHFWCTPNDLLLLMVALLAVALAAIFRIGVEIAEDHRQIV
jgi:hypothetical protein